VDDPDIILLTETWCNSEISNSELAIDGYTLEAELRRDRTDTHNGLGGGLLVYTKIGLAIRNNDRFNGNKFVQFCAFTVIAPQPLNVIVTYRPPNSGRQNLTQLCDLLQNLDPNTIIVGDFNLPDINWQEDYAGSRGRPLLETVRECHRSAS
jgi:hypothetical protein